MTNVVVMDDARESDLRPGGMTGKLLKLLERDLALFFRRKPLMGKASCPGCGGVRRDPALVKFNVRYVQCRDCLTLYVSPRPAPVELARFYRESKALRFWASFARRTDHSREVHIHRPRLDWLASTVRRYVEGPVSYADLQPKYASFMRIVSRTKAFSMLYGLELPPSMKFRIPETGFKTVPGGLAGAEQQGIRVSALTAFEVMERVHDPRSLVRAVASVLHEGGLMLATTRAAGGFDAQVLWERSQTLLPMVHLNLLSVEGAERLLLGAGFDVLELSTPGRLDVQIVRAAALADPTLPLPRFLSYLIRHRGEEAHQAFQEFLQQHRLSSHMRWVARKKTSKVLRQRATSSLARRYE